MKMVKLYSVTTRRKSSLILQVMRADYNLRFQQATL